MTSWPSGLRRSVQAVVKTPLLAVEGEDLFAAIWDEHGIVVPLLTMPGVEGVWARISAQIYNEKADWPGRCLRWSRSAARQRREGLPPGHPAVTCSALARLWCYSIVPVDVWTSVGSLAAILDTIAQLDTAKIEVVGLDTLVALVRKHVPPKDTK